MKNLFVLGGFYERFEKLGCYFCVASGSGFLERGWMYWGLF